MQLNAYKLRADFLTSKRYHSTPRGGKSWISVEPAAFRPFGFGLPALASCKRMGDVSHKRCHSSELFSCKLDTHLNFILEPQTRNFSFETLTIYLLQNTSASMVVGGWRDSFRCTSVKQVLPPVSRPKLSKVMVKASGTRYGD